MNDCSESQTRVCKAYIADCYGHIAMAYNTCKSGERQILKKNIFDMLDRIKMRLNNEIPKIENINIENESDTVDETD